MYTMESERTGCKCISFCRCLQLTVVILYISCTSYVFFTVEFTRQNEIDNLTEITALDYVEDLTVPYIVMNQLFTTLPVIGLLIVYLCLPELQNLQGMIMMSYLLGCAATRGVDVVMYMCSDHSNVLKFTYKYVLFPFGLVQFSWVTIMCFDISTTFSRPLQGPSARANPLFQFLLYSLFGWGIPVLFVAAPSGFDLVGILFTVITEALLCVMLFLSTLVDLGRPSQLRRHGTSPDWLLVRLKLTVLMIMDSTMFFLTGLLDFGIVEDLIDTFLSFQGTILFVMLVFNKRISGAIRKKIMSYKEDVTQENAV